MSEEKASPCVLHIHGENIQVLPNLFNEVFCDCVEPAKLIKSKEFINAIIPLLPFKQGKSLRNIRRAIVKYVLGEG